MPRKPPFPSLEIWHPEQSLPLRSTRAILWECPATGHCCEGFLDIRSRELTGVADGSLDSASSKDASRRTLALITCPQSLIRRMRSVVRYDQIPGVLGSSRASNQRCRRDQRPGPAVWMNGWLRWLGWKGTLAQGLPRASDSRLKPNLRPRFHQVRGELWCCGYVVSLALKPLRLGNAASPFTVGSAMTWMGPSSKKCDILSQSIRLALEMIWTVSSTWIHKEESSLFWWEIQSSSHISAIGRRRCVRVGTRFLWLEFVLLQTFRT